MIIVDFLHDDVNMLRLVFEAVEDRLQAVNYRVSCSHHFWYNLLPLRIKFAECREQFTHIERLILELLWRETVIVEISGVSAFHNDLVEFIRFTVQELWRLVHHSVYHLHELSFLIK